MIEAFHEDITLDDNIGELYFREQVDVDDGKWIPHGEVEKKIAGRCA